MNLTYIGEIPDEVLINQSVHNQSYYSFVRTNCMHITVNFKYIFIAMIVASAVLFYLSHSKWFNMKFTYETQTMIINSLITFVCFMGILVYIALLFLMFG